MELREQLNGIQHVGIPTNDIEMTIAFYEKLGFEMAFRTVNEAVDANGESQTPIMGCYGIGVGRLAASVCEAHHDEYGPIWPKAIAPWQVHLCAVRVDDEEVRAYADKLYEDLQNAGIEVIYDDRSVRAGVMFADADLLGIPLRIIVSPKNMKQGVVEVASRDKTLKTQIPLENVMEEIKQYL